MERLSSTDISSPAVDETGGSRARLRLGAIAGILGIAVQFIASSMHPGHAQPNDSVAAFHEYAASSSWTLIHFGQFAGVLLVVLALVVLAASLPKDGPAGAFAVVGAVAAVLVGGVFAVQMAVDGVALRGSINAWVAAPEAQQDAAYLVASAVRDLEKGLSGFFHLLNGLALLTLGTAVASSRIYPRWLGVFGVLAGIGFMSGGVVTGHTGFSPEAGSVLSPALIAGLVFVIGTCVSMARRSRQPSGRAAHSVEAVSRPPIGGIPA
jgi:hypothetical protein